MCENRALPSEYRTKTNLMGLAVLRVDICVGEAKVEPSRDPVADAQIKLKDQSVFVLYLDAATVCQTRKECIILVVIQRHPDADSPGIVAI